MAPSLTLRFPSRGRVASSTVRRFVFLSRVRQPFAIFLIPGSPQPELGWGAKVSPDHSCYFPSALSRTTPGFSLMHPLASCILARGFVTARSLAFHRAPYIRVRFPTAQTFASNPPRPRLTATPCSLGYPAQERSTGTGLSPVSSTPCRACERRRLAGSGCK